ncbi:MAG: hypothetical protein MHPDNHAH_01018 [Anaerolineales bacterium]|nr:hypothetical protein [Anaerolineales bacterium]
MITVYLWKPRFSIEQAAGHSALEIVTQYRKEYISWHPKGRTVTYQEVLGKGVEGYIANSYEEDVRIENGYANYKIMLSKLDEDVMLEFWNIWRRKLSSFQLLEQNCSHIVSKLLVVGWSGSFETRNGEIDETAINRKLESVKDRLYHYDADPLFLEAGSEKVWDTQTENFIPLSQLLRYAATALGALLLYKGMRDEKDGYSYAGMAAIGGAALASGLDSDHAVWDAKLVSGLAYYIKRVTHDED